MRRTSPYHPAPQALAAMVKLELPHVNVLTKVDLLEDKVGGAERVQGPGCSRVGCFQMLRRTSQCPK